MAPEEVPRVPADASTRREADVLEQVAGERLDALNVCNVKHVKSRQWYNRVRKRYNMDVDKPKRPEKRRRLFGRISSVNPLYSPKPSKISAS